MHIEAPATRPDFSRNVHCVLGLPIDAVDLAAAERRIRAAAASHSRCFVSTPNVNFLIACRSDDAFRNSVINSDLSVADGMPLVWLARLMGIPIRERVAGASLFDALRYGPGRRLSVYFFGGPDGVAKEAWRQLRFEAKGLTCVGYESPGFGSVEEMSSEEIIQRINASKADVLVISLGARKGQACPSEAAGQAAADSLPSKNGSAGHRILLRRVPVSEIAIDKVEIAVAGLQVEPESVRASAALLSDVERRRASRFAFDRERRRFIVARARLRQLLAERLGEI